MRDVGKVVFTLWVVCLLSIPAVLAAQTGTLFVEGDNVGIGTATPGFKLDIQGTDGASTRVQVTDSTSTTAARTLFKLENNGFPRFVLQDSSTGAQWLMAIVGGGDFTFNKTGSGVVEFRSSPGGDLTIAGAMTATVYNTSSSRTLKEAFDPIEGREVLDRVVSLPIEEWSFKGDGVRHMGPMSEDFRAAFGLGSSETHIGLMDAAGVNMAAIQGLHSMVEERDTQIEELQARVERLERLVETLAASRETDAAPSN